MFKLNEDKYKQVILYLCSRTGRGYIWGKKKMYKLLYFLDFDFFEKHERPITGDIYHKLPLGPAPSYFDPIADELRESGSLEIVKRPTGAGLNDTVIYKALAEPNLDVLDREEIKMLDRIINKYGSKTGTELEKMTHKEAPYLAVDEGEEMPLELAHYRGTDFD